MMEKQDPGAVGPGTLTRQVIEGGSVKILLPQPRLGCFFFFLF